MKEFSSRLFWKLIVSTVVGVASSLPLAAPVAAHETSSSGSVVVHITDTGYVPALITVSRGEEVVFENLSNEERWPASDSHPTHTFYDDSTLEQHCLNSQSAAFDACGPIASGDSWSFRFDRAGTFLYHDHLWPHLTGSVVVQDEASDAVANPDLATRRSIIKIASVLRVIGIWPQPIFFLAKPEVELATTVGAHDRFNVLSEHYTALTREADPSHAIETLQQDSETDPTVSTLCHDLLHDIGQVAYSKYGSFQGATNYQSSFCNSGYIHGVFEAYFSKAANPLQDLPGQCEAYSATTGRNFDLWECQHGVGHGLMYLTGGDLDESLKLCEDSFGGSGAGACNNGVYMEIFNNELLANESRFVDPGDPTETCLGRVNESAFCYLYLPSYFIETLEIPYEDVFAKCAAVKADFVNFCMQGIGAEAIKRNITTPAAVFNLCDNAPTSTDQQNCAAGIANMYLNQVGSLPTAESMCSGAPSRYVEICSGAVAAQRASFE
ncbi:MAG: hypothetical protein COW24_05110 [Candidatus Kerfeldbacteria bacterium CG15_BIG_FIL_POST_REV_8_21_14_020_45_12]|uniref:EfeO-type cupredoxin-like domain-containing protein n=1 Tax=Candidatus Kerfeldbacteria bacterium CG15_BIG_FIL_POST_REV_8_21_14_020_45_12 TaxID=2014247 RepID=A0A2M7H2X9_9BACT|nr:MAG: hypothetical protein COW24_05110 [Candidatus Kerfeldbacteria bacterium CG15_BIG_FIL_POST_REV_8_21_14_020_45_12]